MRKALLAAACFTLFASPIYAQTPVLNPVTPLTGTAGPNGSATPVSPTNPLPISGSFSATLSGFTPNGLYASLTATASTSASTAIPTGSTTVRITNLGAGTVSCTFATGAATGFVNNTQVGPSSSVSRAVGAFDHLACIDQTGSSGSQLVIIEGGAGLGNDTGGGGGGSGGAVTLASGVPDLSQAFSITSSTNSTALALFGTQSVQFNLTGTFSATVTGQVSNDNSTWVNVPIFNMTAGAWVAPGTGVTAVGNYMLAGSQGAGWARINVAYTSGTVAGTMRATTQGPSATWGDYLNWVSLTGSTPAGTARIGYTSDDPCAQLTKVGVPINLTGSGQILAGTASKKTYICSIDLVSATAQNIALVEGTGSTCATNVFGLAGGTTAATGWNLSANGGLTKGSGSGTVYSPSADSNATAANVCLLLSGSGQTSGQMTVVQQ